MGQNAWTRLKPDGLATQNKKGLTISYSNWKKLIFQEKFYKNFYIAIPPFWARYFNNRNSKLLEIKAYGNYTSRNFWKYQIQSQSSSQRPLNKSPKIGSKKRKNQIVDKYKFVFFLVFFLNIKKKKKKDKVARSRMGSRLPPPCRPSNSLTLSKLSRILYRSIFSLFLPIIAP